MILDLCLNFFLPVKTSLFPLVSGRQKLVPSAASMVQEKGGEKLLLRTKCSCTLTVYFDYLTLLTMEISWCTIAFSLCWAASARHMLLTKMQHVRIAVLRMCFCWVVLWVAFDP